MISKRFGLLRRKPIFSLFLIAMFALILGAAGPQVQSTQAAIQYEDAEFFIEVNSIPISATPCCGVNRRSVIPLKSCAC